MNSVGEIGSKVEKMGRSCAKDCVEGGTEFNRRRRLLFAGEGEGSKYRRGSRIFLLLRLGGGIPGLVEISPNDE